MCMLDLDVQNNWRVGILARSQVNLWVVQPDGFVTTKNKDTWDAAVDLYSVWRAVHWDS